MINAFEMSNEFTKLFNSSFAPSCDWCNEKILQNEPLDHYYGKSYHKTCLDDLWRDKLAGDELDYGEPYEERD